MKRLMMLAMAAVMLVGLLSACGSKKSETVDADLDEFYDDLEDSYGWDDNYLVDIEGEMLESYYPGLADIETEQFVAKTPMMSATVNEMVFLQCKTEEDAVKAGAILQDRIDAQADGGAWYPESMEAWSKGTVIQQGTYVAMIASAEHQDEIAEKFNALFA
ncbi:DUF4358 domain-containing protein [Oscillibacter sp.]|uniref:DUF4358 domain-containing protein n=1 Tax=Oscillibacter sp. TaxID=1945593 RepID=UPI002631F473|nr:DUF4358 domain-containing protein [Oscillibacter sp.]MDD3348001.1 DUF4358 domain-containing protein [Oscillibacter sp.]